MSALGDTLAVLAAVLDDRGIPWFIFGAQAVAVRGAPRATQDIDITIEISRERLPELMQALEAGGIVHRYPDIVDELLTSGKVLPMSHPSGMEVDIVLAGSGLESLALSRATRVPVEGVDAPIAHATDLVVMKVLAGRGKDLDDVRSVLASGDVDVADARDLLGQLEEALGQSDLLPQLDQAVRDVKKRR